MNEKLTTFLISILLVGHYLVFAQQKIEIPYSKTLHKESINLHVNSNFFVTGESLLFKVYCINPASFKSTELSKVAYVELIDESSNPTFRSAINLSDRQGYGDFFLSSDLRSGNYTLIAYTNWMKNFPVEDFFRKEITIINPLKKPLGITTKTDLAKVDLVPEGNQLIAGIENQILVSTSAFIGKGAKGKLIEDSGKVLTEITTLQEGNRITLVPELGREYKLIIQDSSNNYYFATLPIAQKEGIVLRLSETNNQYGINVLNHDYLKENKFKVSIESKGTKLFETSSELKNDRATITFDKPDNRHRTFSVTILDTTHFPIVQRDFFNNYEDQSSTALILDRKIFNTREKVTLKISPEDIINSARLSIGVRRVENKLIEDAGIERRDKNNPTLNSFLSPYKYFTSGQAGPSGLSITHLPELRGQLIKGTASDEKSGKALSNSIIYCSSPSKSPIFYASKTDSSGNFIFITPDLKSESETVFQLDNPNTDNTILSIEENYIKDHTFFTPSPSEIDSSWKQLILEKSIYSQIENAYYFSKVDSTIHPRNKTMFFGSPDKEYFLDDYTRFETMEDVLREYIPEVFVKKRGNNFSIRVMDFINSFPFSKEPLILIDGVPVFDHNDLMSYNPLLVKKISIVKRRYFYGPLDVSGIISLETYEGSGRTLKLHNAFKTDNIGTKPEKKYYFPNYSKNTAELERIPDFRTQLFWAPNLVIDKNHPLSIDFFTSEVKGEYEIIVEGLEKDGGTLHYRKAFMVK